MAQIQVPVPITVPFAVPAVATSNQSQSRPMPVTRSNILQYSHGPAQAMMYLTPQQQHAARLASIHQHEAARQRVLNLQRQQQSARPGFNQNGKRSREPEQPQNEMGVLVSKRMQMKYGPLVQQHFAFRQTPRALKDHFISPDLMDAIHLGDKGYFLLCESGIRYYIWRFAARRDATSKSYCENLFGSGVEPFSLSLPPNDPAGSPVNEQKRANTYAYVYAIWEVSTCNSFKKFFAKLAASFGVVKEEDRRKALKGIEGHFHQARQIWLSDISKPDNAVAYLRASEEFWWKRSITSSGCQAPPLARSEHGVECMYAHEVDRAPRELNGHYQRALKIWAQPRRNTTDWAPTLYRKPRSSLVKPEKRSWLALLTPAANLQEFLPPLPREPRNLNLVQQARQHGHGMVTYTELGLFDLFEFDRAVESGLCLSEIPNPTPIYADIDSEEDAECDEVPYVKRIKTGPSPRLNSGAPVTSSPSPISQNILSNAWVESLTHTHPLRQDSAVEDQSKCTQFPQAQARKIDLDGWNPIA